jgi:hypothetical protein
MIDRKPDVNPSPSSSGFGSGRRAHWAAACALALPCLAASPAAAYDVSIRDVHVTQGSQTVQWNPGDPVGFESQAGNQLKLVARRDTTVRVLLGYDGGPESTPASDITVDGRVHVFSGEARVTLPEGVRPINGSLFGAQPYSLETGRQATLADENGSLNFELLASSGPISVVGHPGPYAFRQVRLESLASDGQGGLAAVPTPTTATFVVEIQASGAGSDSNPANDRTTVGLPLVSLTRPKIRYTPIAMLREADSRNGPDQELIRPGVGDAFLRAALPIDPKCDPGGCAYAQGGGLYGYNQDANGDGEVTYDIDTGDDDPSTPAIENLDTTEANALLSDLEAQRAMFFDPANPLMDFFTYHYAWLPAAALVGHGGAGRSPGTVGYGNDDPERGQKTFPHEWSHGQGLVQGDPSGHYPVPPGEDMAPDLGWDFGNRLSGNPAENLVPSGRLKGFGLRDLLNNEFVPTNEAWASRKTLETLINNQQRGVGFTPAPGTGGTARAAEHDRPKCERSVTIAGAVDRYSRSGSGAGLRLRPLSAKLRPVLRLPWCTLTPPVPRRDAQLVAEVTTREKGRNRLRRHLVSARTLIDRHLPGIEHVEGDEIVLAGFSLTVPLEGELVSVRLTDVQGRTVYDTLRRSRAAPTVRVRSPQPGARLSSRRQLLSWSASDSDTRSSRLVFNAAYSPDRGRTFYPLAVNVRGRSVRFDARDLPGTARRGLIRLFVSDGLNTRSYDVRSLRNTNARFDPDDAEKDAEAVGP